MRSGVYWSAGLGRRGWPSGGAGPSLPGTLDHFLEPYHIINQDSTQPEPRYESAAFPSYWYHRGTKLVGWGSLLYWQDTPPRNHTANQIDFRAYLLQNSADPNVKLDKWYCTVWAQYYNNGSSWGDPALVGEGTGTVTTTGFDRLFITSRATITVSGTLTDRSLVRYRLQFTADEDENTVRLLGVELLYPVSW